MLVYFEKKETEEKPHVPQRLPRSHRRWRFRPDLCPGAREDKNVDGFLVVQIEKRR